MIVLLCVIVILLVITFNWLYKNPSDYLLKFNSEKDYVNYCLNNKKFIFTSANLRSKIDEENFSLFLKNTRQIFNIDIKHLSDGFIYKEINYLLMHRKRFNLYTKIGETKHYIYCLNALDFDKMNEFSTIKMDFNTLKNSDNSIEFIDFLINNKIKNKILIKDRVISKSVKIDFRFFSNEIEIEAENICLANGDVSNVKVFNCKEINLINVFNLEHLDFKVEDVVIESCKCETINLNYVDITFIKCKIENFKIYDEKFYVFDECSFDDINNYYGENVLMKNFELNKFDLLKLGDRVEINDSKYIINGYFKKIDKMFFYYQAYNKTFDEYIYFNMMSVDSVERLKKNVVFGYEYNDVIKVYNNYLPSRNRSDSFIKKYISKNYNELSINEFLKLENEFLSGIKSNSLINEDVIEFYENNCPKVYLELRLKFIFLNEETRLFYNNKYIVRFYSNQISENLNVIIDMYEVFLSDEFSEKFDCIKSTKLKVELRKVKNAN